MQDTLTCRAHLLGQDRSTTVRSADWIRVELGCQRAGAKDLNRGVATGVTDELGEAHVDAAFADVRWSRGLGCV